MAKCHCSVPVSFHKWREIDVAEQADSMKSFESRTIFTPFHVICCFCSWKDYHFHTPGAFRYAKCETSVFCMSYFHYNERNSNIQLPDLIVILSIHFTNIFQLVLHCFCIVFGSFFHCFWIGFGNYISFIYFLHKCHIPFKIYGIYIVDKWMLYDWYIRIASDPKPMQNQCKINLKPFQNHTDIVMYW